MDEGAPARRPRDPRDGAGRLKQEENSDVLNVPPDCFDIIQHAMRPLARSQRARFLKQLEENLYGREVGVGIIGRICAELQKSLMNAPPDSAPPRSKPP
jgi:hypothetical protein